MTDDSSRLYQVFLSSTYVDLKEERLAATTALLEMAMMPVGMEFFPASNSDPEGVIRQFLRRCDYLVVITAGRYGSVHRESGKSYTELEVDVADELEIPVYAFIHGDIDSIPSKNCETEPELRERLRHFHEKLSAAKTLKSFISADTLGSAVKSTMHHAITHAPRMGWIRQPAVSASHTHPLCGTWALQSTNIPRFATDTSVLCLKDFTDTHCTTIHIEKVSRKVVRCFGGEYYTSGNLIYHTKQYSHPAGIRESLKEPPLQYDIDRDTLTLSGKLRGGFDMEEAWFRITHDILDPGEYLSGGYLYDFD